MALKRAAEMTAGQSPSSDEVELFDGEGLPFLQGNAEFGTKSPTPLYRCDQATRVCRTSDVLLSIRAPVGALNVADRPYGIGRGLCAIRSKTVDQGFLWWLLHAEVEALHALAVGSTYDAVTAEDIGTLRVSVPRLPTQRAIAHFLDAETARIDALIEKKRRMVRLLQERRMSVMTDGVSGKLTGAALVTSGLQWLPERGAAWREAKLNLIARLGSGHTPSRDHPEWWVDSTIPWITTGEVGRLRSDRVEFLFETRERISELGVANSAAEVHPAGTVVLCRTASAGYSAIMGAEMATSQDFATWTCGPLLRPRFLLLCLRVMRQDLLGRLAMGSTHQTIYMPDIEGVHVPLPALNEQDAIVDIVWKRLRAVDDLLDALSRQIFLLQEHRQSLITAAVMGELEGPGAAA
jgi:type I restriction enzyme, S subunit